MSDQEPIDVAIPVLASLDFEETLAFYNKLGFKTAGFFPDLYAIVRRDRMELHFWACKERHLAENTGCYLRISDVDGLHAEYAALDLAPGRMDEPTDQPWGMREFHVWDPHGNLLRIGQIIEED